MTKTRLWSFQRSSIAEALQNELVFRPSWEFVDSHWIPAYQWIAAKMDALDIPIGDAPPIWAWHSCGEWNAAPDAEVARALLSDFELTQGMILVELHIPSDLMLLSRYAPWNIILDWFLDGETVAPFDHLDLFVEQSESPVADIDFRDEIQACIPYIERDWIERVEKLEDVLPEVFSL